MSSHVQVTPVDATRDGNRSVDILLRDKRTEFQVQCESIRSGGREAERLHLHELA